MSKASLSLRSRGDRVVAAVVSGGLLLGLGFAGVGSAVAATESAAPVPAVVAPAITFTDLGSTPFKNEINWLASRGISTGWPTGDGLAEYRPFEPILRDAMAAFLYRMAGSPGFPTLSYEVFADTAGTVFEKHMTWMADVGVSTGWLENGIRTYRPFQPVLRAEMAAFLYRLAGSPAYSPPSRSPFVDVSTNHTFYKQIAWLGETRISTGWIEGGQAYFRPQIPILRDAMAAFLYRFHHYGYSVNVRGGQAPPAMQLPTPPGFAISGVVNVPFGTVGEADVIDFGSQSNYGSIAFVFRNNTGRTIYNYEVDARGRRAEGGEILGTGTSSSVMPKAIGPGEWGFGSIYFGDRAPEIGWIEYNTTSSGSPGFYRDIAVIESNFVTGRYDNKIVGVLRNSSTGTIGRPIEVAAVCFDAGGQLLRHHSDYADGSSDVPPGGTASFTINLWEWDCPNYAVGARGWR